MNIYALLTGIITAMFIIMRFKRSRLEKTKLAYPLLLASFPVFYFIFAIYVNDLVALYKEIIVGIIFFSLVFVAIQSTRKTSAILVGSGCILHALYDQYHNMIFINPGSPSWWFEFCGSIDLILGLYLIYLAITTPNIKWQAQP